MIDWLKNIDQNENNFNTLNWKVQMYNMIHRIQTELIQPTQRKNHDLIHKILLCNCVSEEHLPMPIYFYVRSNFATQFILHVFHLLKNLEQKLIYANTEH